VRCTSGGTTHTTDKRQRVCTRALQPNNSSKKRRGERRRRRLQNNSQKVPNSSRLLTFLCSRSCLLRSSWNEMFLSVSPLSSCAFSPSRRLSRREKRLSVSPHPRRDGVARNGPTAAPLSRGWRRCCCCCVGVVRGGGKNETTRATHAISTLVFSLVLSLFVWGLRPLSLCVLCWCGARDEKRIQEENKTVQTVRYAQMFSHWLFSQFFLDFPTSFYTFFGLD
jgi:hypothetical protein